MSVAALIAWQAAAPRREVTIAHRPDDFAEEPHFACATEHGVSGPLDTKRPVSLYIQCYAATPDEAAAGAILGGRL